MLQWTDDSLAELTRRLRHLTFVIKDTLTVTISARNELYRRLGQSIVLYKTGDKPQPALLRMGLRALSACRWRYESSKPEINVSLERWELTQAVIAELSALPVFPHPAQLTFNAWAWHTRRDYRQLAGLVPTCYSTWHLHGAGSLGDWQIEDMCEGAEERGRACERLTPVVYYGRGSLTTADRTSVETYIYKHGLSEWLKPIQWVMGCDGEE